MKSKEPSINLEELKKIYPETDYINELICQVDDIKKCLDSFIPLNPEQVKNLQEANIIRSYAYEFK